VTLNRENLTKLADYLDSLPDNYRSFMMSDFLVQTEYDPAEIARYMTEPNYNMCGSAACAIGHAPAAGIKVDMSTFTEYDKTSDMWDYYHLEAFGIDWGEPISLWMFGGDWTYVDNTPKGAAARIRFILDGKTPPDINGEPFDDSEMNYKIYDSRVTNETYTDLYKEYLK